MLRFLKQQLIDWCLSRRTLTAGQILACSNLQTQQIDGPDGNVKFTSVGRTDLLVQTPKGWSSIKRTLKTVPYEVYELVVGDKTLRCADEHLVITPHGQQAIIYLEIGDKVLTIDGLESVKSVKSTGVWEEMCDFELDDEDHIFYTNGILSHNTLTTAMYLLWYAMFNSDSTILIASKNQGHALEIGARVRFAYEQLPNWAKCGVRYYNRHNIEFDNGSRIISEATTEKTGRGLSLTKIYLDELAFIDKRIQDEMWASLSPTLSTGGSAIISSTPNGDTELFSHIWRGAMAGLNGYMPFQVDWREHPERGDDYWDLMVGQLGLLAVRQEVGCFFAQTPISTSIGKLTMEQLYATIGEQEIRVVQD